MTAILYSFRRCPYAIRARLAIASAGVHVELREILLRDKPAAFLDASPSATVPCLVSNSGVLDESLDVMTWALGQSDPEKLLDMPEAGRALIDRFDGPFKRALDLTKYAVRHPGSDPEETRAEAMEMLSALEDQLAEGWLFGARPDAGRSGHPTLRPSVREYRQGTLRQRGNTPRFGMVRDVFSQ